MPTIYNQASLNYNNTVTYSNIVRAELVNVLSVTKTAVQSTYDCNDVITYTVSIINARNRAFSGLTLRDDLGSYSYRSMSLYPTTYVPGSVNYYVNGVLQADPAVTAGPPLTINNITVPGNGNVLIIYSVRINEYAPLASGSAIENTVTITGGGLSDPVTATARITAANSPCLSICKSINSDRITENEPVVYTIRLQNNGPASVGASDNVIIHDTLNPPLSLSSVTFNGVTWRNGINYSYNEATGEFTTHSGQITIPAASYRRSAGDGMYMTTPGASTLVITGNV